MLAALKLRRTRPGLTALYFDIGGISLAQVNFGPERRNKDKEDAGARRKPVLEACHYRAYAGAASPAEVLKQLDSEFDLAHARCTTLLGSDQYKLVLTEKPDVGDAELATTLRWSIQDQVESPVEDLAIEVFRAPDSGTMAMSYVVAADKQAIHELVKQLHSAELEPQIIDIEELAQRNIAGLLPEDEDGVALMRLSRGNGLITVTRQGELYFSRKLTIGAEALEEESDDASIHERLILDLQRTMDYYERQFKQAAIKHIYLAGLPEPKPAFHQAIIDNLGIQPGYLDLQQLMHCPPDLPADWQIRNFLAIGAALRLEEHSA